MNNTKETLKPLLKYPGGKTAELPIISKYIPQVINKYIEPFLGGGAVYFSINANNFFVNDKSEDLMLLYEYIKYQNQEFYDELETIDGNWRLLGNISDESFNSFCDIIYKYKQSNFNKQELELNVLTLVKTFENLDKPLFQLENIRQPIFNQHLIKSINSIIKRICKNEILKNKILEKDDLKDNFECSIKSAYYTYFRELYNYPEKYTLSKPRSTAIFLFIREYCYSSMYRFNNKGKFNVPYGGISYNKKSLYTKIEYYKSPQLIERLRNTVLSSEDFLQFVSTLDLDNSDFMFLDPPYDTQFSEYDKNRFDQNDQDRLANYLINECPCKFMVVIKKTDFIVSLYSNHNLNIYEFDKNYFVSFKNRNKKNVKHLLITNY